MGKTAFVFPGQGSQYVGMGKDLYDNYSSARQVFQVAEDATGLNISQLCFDGPEHLLAATEITQPAVLTVSIACLNVLEEHGIKADCVAGLSLGEYSAHVAAGTMDFSDAARIVKNRGHYMEEAVQGGKGIMAAIIGLDIKFVETICEKASAKGVVMAANYNCPGQVVISGEKGPVLYASEIAKTEGSRKVVILEVSGPFHTPLMEGAGRKLSADLERITIQSPKVPLIANVKADYVEQASDIRDSLVKQVSSPVRWMQSVEKMIHMGVERFVEVGPGKSLAGHIKRINKHCVASNVEDLHTLELLLDSWGEVC